MSTKMTRIKPAQEPQAPNTARKGSSSIEWPWNSQRFSETSVAEVDGAPGEEIERLLSVRGQLKTRGPFVVRLMYAKGPKRRMKMSAQSGWPDLSMQANIDGAYQVAART